MRVLILCNDFYPFNSIGAERPYSWFKYLHTYGHDVTVVTKNWKKAISDPSQLLENIANDKKEEILPEGRIIRLPQYTIFPEKVIKKFGLKRFRFLRKLTTFLYKLLSFSSLRFDQHSNIYRAALEELNSRRYDVLVTTAEPHILFRYGYLLKSRFPQLKWIADYRDGWYLNHVTSISSSPLIKLMRKREFIAEKKFLKRADVITSVDPSLAKRLGELHSKPYDIIYNGFWEFYAGQQTSQKLTFVHSGTLTPAQRIDVFLGALKELVEEKEIYADEIDVIFVGLAFYPDRWKRVADFSETLEGIVRNTQRVSKDEAIRYNLIADYLLIFTEDTSQAIFANTYDYIACQKSLLVSPDDQGILGELVKDYQLGTVIDEKTEMREFLLEAIWSKRAGKLNTILERNEQLSFFTREAQANELSKLIERISR